MFLHEIVNIIEAVAPLKWQEAWDNSGLQVGNRNAQIHAVLLTTDVTETVVCEAVERHCDLIISHHPLLFHGLKHLCDETPQERCVALAIKHNIAIYSAHTTMDCWLHGVSGRMAERIGLTDYRLLTGEEYGLGVIGTLPEALPLNDFLQRVKTAFDAPMLRYVTGPQQTVSTVALCGGAGSEFVQNAIAEGADTFITADVKYHTFLDMAGQINLIDLDHWVSEHFTRDIFRELLQDKLPIHIAQTDKSPINIY